MPTKNSGAKDAGASSKVSKNKLIKQRLNEKMKPTSFMQGKAAEDSSFTFNKPLLANQSASFLTDATQATKVAPPSDKSQLMSSPLNKKSGHLKKSHEFHKADLLQEEKLRLNKTADNNGEDSMQGLSGIRKSQNRGTQQTKSKNKKAK